jgi:hypothetical protein
MGMGVDQTGNQYMSRTGYKRTRAKAALHLGQRENGDNSAVIQRYGVFGQDLAMWLDRDNPTRRDDGVALLHSKIRVSLWGRLSDLNARQYNPDRVSG